MWSETVSVLWGQDRSETKIIGLGLGLAGLVLCCETRSCYARHHDDLEGQNKFSSTICSFFYAVLATSLLRRSTAAFT